MVEVFYGELSRSFVLGQVNRQLRGYSFNIVLVEKVKIKGDLK